MHKYLIKAATDQQIREFADGALSMLKETNPERTDVMIPAKTLRDSEGNIIGCTGLSLV